MFLNASLIFEVNFGCFSALNSFGKVSLFKFGQWHCLLTDPFYQLQEFLDNFWEVLWERSNPAGIYFFKVNKGNRKTMWKLFRVHNKDTRTTADVVLESLLLTLNKFYTLFWSFHCWLLGKMISLNCWV